MKVGDLVKHKYGTLYGEGLILEMLHIGAQNAGDPKHCRVMWNCHGHITVHSMTMQYFEVISEGG